MQKKLKKILASDNLMRLQTLVDAKNSVRNGY